MFRKDPTAKVVFYVMSKDLSCGVLDNYPYPTPQFNIRRTPHHKRSYWEAELKFDLGFTDTMTSRSDVLNFMLQAPNHVDTTDATTTRVTVTKLLLHWAEMFPTGVPDSLL